MAWAINDECDLLTDFPKLHKFKKFHRCSFTPPSKVIARRAPPGSACLPPGRRYLWCNRLKWNEFTQGSKNETLSR